MTPKTFSKKYNLHCGNQPREGYENKDKRINPEDSYDLMYEIEGIVSDIIVNPGCLESTARPEIKKYFDGWHKALSTDGTLILYYCDPYISANNLLSQKMQLPQFENQFLRNGWISLYDMKELTNALIASNFKIKNCYYHDSIGVINATKGTSSISL